MKKTLLPAIALVGALALVPATTAGLAQVDSATYKELDNFMSVFERVRGDYVEKVDDHTLMKGAIDGMLAALDPHSSFAEGSDYESIQTLINGNYGGLGITVGMEDGTVKVVSPTEDTPAWRAGIKAGDYITHINGELMYGFKLDEAVEKMRGLPGSDIRLTLVRPGRDKPFDVRLVRERIQLRPVKWEVKDNIGIININQFVNGTGAATEAALVGIDKATGGNAVGYVIDLRSNPGGSLDEAIKVSDAFLESGEVVSQRGREKNDIQRYYANPGDLAHGKPVIVLIDVGSASASEIVAGALQDHRRGLVMGQRSFGKGSVQSIIDMGPKSSLRLTTARYYTPSGHSVQEGGIDPDLTVPQLSDADYKDRPVTREADLRRHLLNQSKVDDKLLQQDDSADPRFTATAAELKKKGIDDFQLSYALNALKRLAPASKPGASVAAKARR